MTGQTLGNLTVIKRAESSKGHVRWLCRCSCGNETIVDSWNLRTGHTTSCGHCERYEKIANGAMRCFLPSGDTFLIDEDDYPEVSKHRWSIENNGYVHTTVEGEHIRLHRVLLNNPKAYVDHWNGDRSDNRRCNLRICSNKENIRNSKLNKNNSTGYKGVSYDGREGRRKHYYSSIMVDGKGHFLGYFETPLEAALAYDKAASFYFGEFVKPNFGEGGIYG
mgnify:CR=1 FL=1